ncbi:peptidylprolyl isomerase, partial [Citrobacter sp. AAK_AS5]
YTVTEEQAKEWYEQQKDRFRRPEAHGWVMSIKGGEGGGTAERMKAQQEARKKAEAARERIEKGEDFEKVAREVSQDECASSGGLVA